MDQLQVRNMRELYPILKGDLEEYLDRNSYRKVWLEYCLENKKKQLYGFTITLFPHGNRLYEQRFVYRIFVNFAKKKNENGEKVYYLDNYEEVLNKLVEQLS